MSETPEQTVDVPPVEQEETKTEPVGGESALTEELQNILLISPGVDSSGCSASGETDLREKPEQAEQTVSVPEAEPPSESTVNLQGQDWRSGSRCRAVYSGDGLVYPAVVLWVKGQRCCVRYDDYNNEEEQDVGSLLKINEFIGPSRAASAKGGGRRTNLEKPMERGAERRSAWRDDQSSSSWSRDRGHQGRAEREEKKKDGDKATNHSPPFFPPFAAPLHSNSGDSQAFVPPAPPPPFSWAGGGKDSAGADSASSMLMLWYMCGFHTGSYLAQQAFRSKD
ncbi:uncharacterized protein LOC141789315 [Halichoeres trimaculatus]|uniref:uncharacterized protein LOC141789315 n=1 Tax=Halichoeres trimaculatus TaxID=147232 RepID=UPI003D9E8D09